MATALYRETSFSSLPHRPTVEQSRFVEDFFSTALDDDDTYQRMQSPSYQHLHPSPPSPSISALTFHSELVGPMFPLDRSVNGDGYDLEPSVVEERYEELGEGRVERLGGKVHLRGMAKMKNELLRQQYKELEPVRQREEVRELARQTTLVNKSLARQLRDTTALLAVFHLKTGILQTQSSEAAASSMILKEELARAKIDLGKEKEEVRRAKKEADELRVREKEARERLLRYAEELKVRDAKAQGRREGKEEAMEEMQRWITSPPIQLPPMSNDQHRSPPPSSSGAPRREPSPRGSSPPRRQDTLSPSYRRHEPPLSTEESIIKSTPFFSPVVPIPTPPLERRGSVQQRSDQPHLVAPPPVPSQQQLQQPAPPPQVIYIQMPLAPIAAAQPPPPPPPPTASQPVQEKTIIPRREPSPSPQTIPKAPTTAQAPNPPLYRPSAITPPMQRLPQHFRPQGGPVRSASRMTSVSAIGGDERDINMDIWKAPSQQTGVPAGMGGGVRPKPFLARTGQHTQQGSWSTVGRGGEGRPGGIRGGFVVGVDGGKGKDRAQEDGGDFAVLGSATKRNSKFPTFPVEEHPSRKRDPEVEWYPEPKDYSEFDKSWEAVPRLLNSLPPSASHLPLLPPLRDPLLTFFFLFRSDSSAGGSYIGRNPDPKRALGSPLFQRYNPPGHRRDGSNASSFRIAGPPDRVVIPPRQAPPSVQATPQGARSLVNERSRSPAPRAPSPSARAPSANIDINRGPSPLSRPLPPDPLHRPRQIILPAPLGPNLPTSAAKPPQHRPARSESGFDHGPSSLLRDPARDRFYSGAPEGGQPRGVSMYGGAPGWPGTTSDALGLSVPPEGGRKRQGGGGDFLGGSGRKRRDSIAPSINIQAPSTERSPTSRVDPSPLPTTIPLPSSAAPSRAPSRAASRAPTIYHHSQPLAPTPSKPFPPPPSNVFPASQLARAPQDIQLPASRAPTIVNDSGRGSPSSQHTSRPNAPPPLVMGKPRRPSMDQGSNRPLSPTSGLLSPTSVRTRFRALLGTNDEGGKKTDPPPAHTIDVGGGGPSPVTSPRSQPRNLNNRNAAKPSMFTLPNQAQAQQRLAVQVPLPASRPGSSFFGNQPPPPPPKDGAVRGGAVPRKKGYPASMVSVDSQDSAWVGENKGGGVGGDATPRPYHHRPRPPTVNGGGTIASTIEEESESDAKRSRLSKERSRER